MAISSELKITTATVATRPEDRISVARTLKSVRWVLTSDTYEVRFPNGSLKDFSEVDLFGLRQTSAIETSPKSAPRV